MLTVGVDLGGTNVHTVVIDEQANKRGEARLRTPMAGDHLGVIDVIETSVRDACDEAGVSIADLAAVGVGTPGVVIDGTVGGASNVPGWSERFSLADMLRDRLQRPLRVANDVTASAIGEHREGAAVGMTNVLVVFVGTGVGAGLIIHGQPYEGNGGAGEFGHTVVVRDGAICPCGRRGCVEAYIGRRAMVQAAERARSRGRDTVLFDIMEQSGKHRPTSGVFAQALAAGDELTADLLGDGISALGAGIASAVNLLDVEAVVLGGGLADKLGDWFRIRVEAAMRPHLFLQPPTVRLLPAALGDDAGAVGAALLARDVVPPDAA
jgi:glucokinase